MDNDKIEELFSRISRLFLETSDVIIFFDEYSNLLIRFRMDDSRFISYNCHVLTYNEILNARIRGGLSGSYFLSELAKKQFFLFDDHLSIFSHMQFINSYGRNLYTLLDPKLVEEFERCEGAKMISKMGIPKSVEELEIKLDLIGFQAIA